VTTWVPAVVHHPAVVGYLVSATLRVGLRLKES